MNGMSVEISPERQKWLDDILNRAEVNGEVQQEWSQNEKITRLIKAKKNVAVIKSQEEQIQRLLRWNYTSNSEQIGQELLEQ